MSELIAFTAEHVRRLTGLTVRQLRYWDDTGFFSPTLLKEHRSRSFGRIYAFRDVVGLRTIASLRPRVPLQGLRRIGEWLSKHHDEPWSSLSFYIAGKRVVFKDPASGAVLEPRGAGQEVLEVALEPIANLVRDAAEKLKGREDNQIGKFARNRYVVHNAWVVAGTRIPTAAIWRMHMARYSIRQIIHEYPRLKPADVRAAIQFERKQHRVA